MSVAIKIQVSEQAARSYQQSSKQAKDEIAQIVESWCKPQTEGSKKRAGKRIKKTLDEIGKQIEEAGLTIEDVIDDPKVIKNLQ